MEHDFSLYAIMVLGVVGILFSAYIATQPDKPKKD